MISSRLNRYENKKQKQLFLLAIGGTLSLIILLGIFGVKLLIGFSLFADKLRGNQPTPSVTQSLTLPPELDPIYEATYSATISVTGRATPEFTVYLSVNDVEPLKMVVDKDGNFTFDKVLLHEGENTISAKQTDTKNLTSADSAPVKITLKKTKPKIVIDKPEEGFTLTGEKNILTTTGKTDEGNSLTVNDRMTVVRNDGSFSYDLPLSEGETTLKFVSTDTAGNTTTMERKVNYKK